jgi:lysophospholipase L1-like esterase
MKSVCRKVSRRWRDRHLLPQVLDGSGLYFLNRWPPHWQHAAFITLTSLVRFASAFRVGGAASTARSDVALMFVQVMQSGRMLFSGATREFRMRNQLRSVLKILLVASATMIGNVHALEPGQLRPTRLLSIGDSLTRGANANLPGDNINNSGVNGYYGWEQQLFGLPNVNSHNQRITAKFGSSGRRNWIAAQDGARVRDMAAQAAATAALGATYATVMLGGNDVCRNSPAELPTDAEFAGHVRNGLTTLLNGLPNGATVLVVAIPNVKALYDLGQVKTALGITSCPRLWRLTGFCGAMLSRYNTESDRLYVQLRNVGYNRILEQVSRQTAVSYPGKFVRFSPAGYQLPSAQEHISDLDCFHASWRGQRRLSALTWPGF